MMYRQSLIQISLKSTAISTLNTILYINPLKRNLLLLHNKIKVNFSLLSSDFFHVSEKGDES